MSQNSFNQEEAKKEGSIKPKRGVDEDYDSCVDALKEIHKDLDDYLVAQTKHFGTKIKYIGTNKTRYQIEVPEAHTRKVGSGYDLVGQRKGFKRYYTAETRVSVSHKIKSKNCLYNFYLFHRNSWQD